MTLSGDSRIDFVLMVILVFLIIKGILSFIKGE